MDEEYGERGIAFEEANWALGLDVDKDEELDMSDLWVSDETVPLTKSRGKKYSFKRQK